MNYGILYSLNKSEDKMDTNLYATFIIHDFEKSHNNQLISEEECKNNMHTLINHPILVKYYNEGDSERDRFGDHEIYITKNRDTGDDIVAFDTRAIGVFNNARIDDIDINGNKTRCLLGDAILWADRYYNACSLLYEWINEKKIPVMCSCEYLFKNYEIKDDVQYIKTPYSYEGHTILNSEAKDGYDVVYPAYENAILMSFNQAIHEDILVSENNKANKGESEILNENIFLKSLNDISIGETRSGIFDALSKVMTYDEYCYMWLSDWDIFEDYFVYETYLNNKWVNFKVTYTNDENGMIIDFEHKQEVKFENVMVEVGQATTMVANAVADAQTEMNQTIEEKDGEIISLNETVNQKDSSIIKLEEDRTSLNEKITSLNMTIDGLKEYEQKYNEDRYQVALNNAQNFYKTKFIALRQEDQFGTEDVQGLIKDTLDNEKSINAKEKLSDMLLGFIQPEKDDKNLSVNSQGSITIIENGQSLNNLTTPKTKKDIDLYRD